MSAIKLIQQNKKSALLLKFDLLHLQAIEDLVKKNIEKESKKHKDKLAKFHTQYEEIDATLKDLRHQRYVSKDLPEDDYIELKTDL